VNAQTILKERKRLVEERDRSTRGTFGGFGGLGVKGSQHRRLNIDPVNFTDFSIIVYDCEYSYNDCDPEIYRTVLFDSNEDAWPTGNTDINVAVTTGMSAVCSFLRFDLFH
jgi:hypothetical protein